VIPGFCLTRLNQRYQEEPMTCKTPCDNCKCEAKKACDTLPIDDDFPFEADASPLGTQTRKFFEEDN